LLLEALLQHLRRRLQVNHQVGGGHILPEKVVVAAVNVKLLIAQVQTGEKLVFLEDIVGDEGLVGIAFHFKRGQLFVARNKESELSLESGSRLALVERLEKRIAIRLAD